MMPSIATIKLVGAVLATLAIAFLVHEYKYWHGQATSARAQVEEICSAARDAAGNPKLDCKDTAAQVRALGTSLAATTGALNRQNAAVDALAKETSDQQQKAAEAAHEARQRAKGPEDVSADLRASARAPERAAKPCEPSDALKERWK
jgi:chromosome segregation ATPase